MGMMPPGAGPPMPPMNPQMGNALAALAASPPTAPPPAMGPGAPQPSPTGAPPPTGLGGMDAGAGGKDLRSKASAVIMGLQDLKSSMPSMAPAIDGIVAQLMDAAKAPSSGHASEMAGLGGPPPVGPGM